MTTIVATRDRMVCDSKLTHGDTSAHGKKVFRHRGALIGTAGSSDQLGAFVRWYKAGAKPGDIPQIKKLCFDILVLTKDGKMILYGSTFEADELDDEYYAVGTGAHAALAALKCGKTPEEAVEIACLIDVNSGPPVKTHLLAEPKRTPKGGANG